MIKLDEHMEDTHGDGKNKKKHADELICSSFKYEENMDNHRTNHLKLKCNH